ncbi:MAG: transcription elongation factor GreB, partial [Xanthomonadaceae bacterium]|nr:transcription elongation factor GreB [Xanthomonadaceae bacterium]
LREIDRRIRYLQKRLPDLQVVERPPGDPERVFFGAWVELEDESGAQRHYRIVGPDEFDAAQGYISMDSPLGRALLRKAVDDEVTVEVPGGRKTYFVVEIRYETKGDG